MRKSAALGSNRSDFRARPDGLIFGSRKFSHPVKFLRLRPVKTVQAKGCPPVKV